MTLSNPQVWTSVCSMSGVVTSTGERIVGWCGLPSPRAWTSVVPLLLSSCSGWTCIWHARWGKPPDLTILPFSDCWKVHWRQTLRFVCYCKCVWCMCSTLAYVSLREWARTGVVVHGWVGCVVVWKFRAPLPLPPVIETVVSLLNEVDVWFRVIVTLISCFVAFYLQSFSFIF